MEELEQLKNFCKALAVESQKIILTYFRSELNIETKFDKSPVTIADKKAEEIMRSMILKEFPEHGIVGEEYGEQNPEAEYKWILDPIDGTKSFICGTPLFGTLIALVKNESPILGVINLPALNQYLVGDNNSAELNRFKVSVRKCEKIENAILLSSDQTTVEKYRTRDGFEKLIRQVKLYRMWGDCYGYYLLASGYADIMIDPIMNKWDLAALIPIIKGAGGTITDYYGNDPMKGNSIVATCGTIHNETLKILNQ
jgi:myo-inositol-1(or 4)-monophosphatase